MQQLSRPLGFRRGKSNPCLFYRPDREVRSCVHGGDFFSVATPEGLDWFENEILRRFDGKVKGRLRQSGDEVRVLNRIARRTSSGYEWEADQCHAEILGIELGLTEGCKPLTVPGRKLAKEELDQEERLMESKSATAYRAMAARANFLAIDRPDIAFSVKELCRRMSAPP